MTPLEQRAAAGDASAFEQLVARWDDDLRGVAWSVIGGQGVDDVMQDAYERAFRSIGGFDGRASLKTWLHTIVYRTAIDWIRYEQRRRHDAIDETVMDLRSRSRGPDQALSGMELEDLLARLPMEQRVALMLTVGLGYSYDEAAEITGESRGTVASRVNRARRRLERWEETSVQ